MIRYLAFCAALGAAPAAAAPVLIDDFSNPQSISLIASAGEAFSVSDMAPTGAIGNRALTIVIDDGNMVNFDSEIGTSGWSGTNGQGGRALISLSYGPDDSAEPGDALNADLSGQSAILLSLISAVHPATLEVSLESGFDTAGGARQGFEIALPELDPAIHPQLNLRVPLSAFDAVDLSDVDGIDFSVSSDRSDHQFTFAGPIRTEMAGPPVVPVPAGLPLLVAALGALAVLRRRPI
jgi:hypothetical protein